MARRRGPQRRVPKADPQGSYNRREVVDYTRGMWDGLSPLYRYWGERWRRTVEFLRSQHWNALKDTGIEKMPKYKRYPVINYTLAIYNDYLRQWMQQRVRYSAVPASSDPGDIGAANMAENALKYAWDVMRMDEVKLEVGAWLLATGNCATRVYWDTDTGNMLPLAIPGEGGELIPVNPETLQPDPSMGEPILVDAGELAIDVINPQLVRWPRSKRHGAMVGMLMTEDEVAERYGEDILNLVEFEKFDIAQVADLSFVEAPGVTTGAEEQWRALVIEHYLPRTKTHPGGLWWTINGKEVLTRPAALPGSLIPITQFKWLPLPGSRLGVTPLHDITYSNKMYDEIAGKMQEWAVRVNPKRLLKEGGGIELGEFDDEAGQEVVVNVGGEPEWETPPQVPQQFFSLLQQNSTDMQFVAGYTMREEDRPVPGQTQANLRQPHRLNDGREVAVAEISSKASWQHLGSVVLAYMKQFYTQGRTLAVVGPDRQWEWFYWDQVDVSRLPSDIKVDEIPLYAHNRQAQTDTVIGLLNSQGGSVLLSDIGPDGSMVLDKDRIEIVMQAIGIDVGMEQLDPDIAEARNEHVAFRMGMPIEVQEHMNHAVHVMEHERVKKGIEYRGWSDESKQALDADVQQHKQVLSDSAQQQQQQMLETEEQMRMIKARADVAEDVQKMLAKEIIEGAIGQAVRGIFSEFMPENRGKKDGE